MNCATRHAGHPSCEMFTFCTEKCLAPTDLEIEAASLVHRAVSCYTAFLEKKGKTWSHKENMTTMWRLDGDLYNWLQPSAFGENNVQRRNLLP